MPGAFVVTCVCLIRALSGGSQSIQPTKSLKKKKNIQNIKSIVHDEKISYIGIKLSLIYVFKKKKNSNTMTEDERVNIRTLFKNTNLL